MSPNGTGPAETIIIVGAGIGGCAAAASLALAGHNVHVLEQKRDLSEFGAGIQILPSAVRCLEGWGLKKVFEDHVFKPESVLGRQYNTGEVLVNRAQNVKNYAKNQYGYEHWLIHRPDYQKILANAAVEAGARLELNARVISIDVERAAVGLADGRTIAGALIIAADGIKSKTRSMLPFCQDVEPIACPEITYRATIPREKMNAIPETAELMNSRNSNSWFGPGKWIISYPIAKGELFNMVLPVRKEGVTIPPGAWNVAGDLKEVRRVFGDFEPRVQLLLGLVDNCTEWVVSELPPLESYSSENGRFLLMGDAAHAMMPHCASGATMAIEDAATLATILSSPPFTETRDLRAAGQAYSALRQPRCERMQLESRRSAAMLGASDEAAKEERDRRYKVANKVQENLLAMGQAEMKVQGSSIAPDVNGSYADVGFQMWLYGHDVVHEVGGFSFDYWNIYVRAWLTGIFTPAAERLVDIWHHWADRGSRRSIKQRGKKRLI